MKKNLVISKRGIPCLWESGGGMSNTGESQIICDKHGRPKNAIYERIRGPLACAEHALVPVAIGDYVVEVDRQRDRYNVKVHEIVKIADGEATCRQVKASDKISDAVQAAKEKACIYHCRSAVYIKKKSSEVKNDTFILKLDEADIDEDIF